ncbi:MAG: ATPase domain-containing protein [Candidatus Bathyarchaeia archaeon]
MLQRFSTGLPELDGFMEGGFPHDATILLVGFPGSGKTTFSSQFLYNAVTKNNLKGVYVSYAETKESFMQNMLRFGWNFEQLEKEGKVSILDLSVTKEIGLQKHIDLIIETMRNLDAQILIIDPVSAMNMGFKEQIEVRVMMHLLYRFLKKANCMAILIMDQPWGTSTIGEGISEFIVDGIIHLETYFDKKETLRRRMRILKMRGTSHIKTPIPYDINQKGFVIITKKSRNPKKDA